MLSVMQCIVSTFAPVFAVWVIYISLMWLERIVKLVWLDELMVKALDDSLYTVLKQKGTSRGISTIIHIAHTFG